MHREQTDESPAALLQPFSRLLRKAGWWAQVLGSVPEMVIRGIFLWCFTPELYASKPEYMGALAAFVRGRPAQPLSAPLHSHRVLQEEC